MQTVLMKTVTAVSMIFLKRKEKKCLSSLTKPWILLLCHGQCWNKNPLIEASWIAEDVFPHILQANTFVTKEPL